MLGSAPVCSQFATHCYCCAIDGSQVHASRRLPYAAGCNTRAPQDTRLLVLPAEKRRGDYTGHITTDVLYIDHTGHMASGAIYRPHRSYGICCYIHSYRPHRSYITSRLGKHLVLYSRPHWTWYYLVLHIEQSMYNSFNTCI